MGVTDVVDARLGETGESVQEIFRDAREDADQYSQMVERAITGITAAAQSLAEESLDIEKIDGTDIGELPEVDLSGMPEIDFDGLTLTMPEYAPGDIRQVKPLELDNPPVPELGVAPPQFLNVSEPKDLDLGDVPVAPPMPESREIPSAPDIVLPTAPTFDQIVTPDAPVIDVPKLDMTAPTLEEIELPEAFSFSPEVYHDDVFPTLLSKVLKAIESGGTGLEPEVEQAIFDRAKERSRLENEKRFREVEEYHASRGFSLPTGSLTAMLLEVQSEVARQIDDVNREILIKQAELAQENTQYSQEMGLKLGSQLQDFFFKRMGIAFESAKAMSDASIALYNSRVEASKAKVERYRIVVSAYAEQVRAVLSQVDVFRAQVEASKLQGELQKNQVEVYTAMVGAAESYVRLYNSQVEAVKIAAEVDNLKLQGFKTAIEGYVAKSNVNVSQWNAYSAKIQGEGAKTQAYVAQVGAWAQQVQAYSAERDSRIAEYKAKLDGTQVDAEVERLKLEQYKAQLGAIAAESDIKVKGYDSYVRAFNANVQAQIGGLEAKLKEIDLISKDKQYEREYSLEMAKENAQFIVSLRELAMKGLESQGGIAAQCASAALSAINAHISSSASVSTGANYSMATSESTSTSIHISAD